MRSCTPANKCLLCVALLLAFIASSAHAAPGIELSTPTWTLLQPAPGNATLNKLADGSMEITIVVPSDPFYRIQLTQPLDIPIDHQFRLSFRARSQTRNPIHAIVEHAVAPYVSCAHLSQTLGPDWQNYEIEGDSPGYGPAGLNMRFQVGQQKGTIDLADIRVVDLGVDPVLADAALAIQPAAIAARIEKYRKRTMDVHITDATGHAMPNMHVEVTQTRHAFLFGSNIFRLDIHDTNPAQIEYQQRFAALFNYATLPFYWNSYEKPSGKTDVQRLTEMATWCRDHHIVTKGHPLVYAVGYPKWAPHDADSTIPLLHARVTDLIGHYDGLINIWDVVNEAISASNHASTGIGAWVVRDGAAQVVGTVLQWARIAGANRKETFLYNDFDSTRKYLSFLHWLQDHHQLPDVIGMQSHMHGGTWRPREIWATAQRLSQYGVPVHFTETTVLSGENRTGIKSEAPPATDWKTTPQGEQAQADYVVQFYSILFSHPSVQAITWWDFSDKGAWMGAPAGLLRADMSPKPAYDALMKLIHHDWWTHEQLTSDSAGLCQSRVFCGQYTITVTDAYGRRLEKQIDVPLSIEDAPPVVSVKFTMDRAKGSS